VKRTIVAVVVSFLAVAGAGLLLAQAYQPATSAHGMVSFAGTLAAVVTAVVAANVWASRGDADR